MRKEVKQRKYARNPLSRQYNKQVVCTTASELKQKDGDGHLSYMLGLSYRCLLQRSGKMWTYPFCVALVGSKGWSCSGAAAGHAVLHQRGTKTKKWPPAKKSWSLKMELTIIIVTKLVSQLNINWHKIGSLLKTHTWIRIGKIRSWTLKKCGICYNTLKKCVFVQTHQNFVIISSWTLSPLL